eukprot:TRINITY_DN47398_c0_g1_i1.p1 TRINITY_DN47398_c0_g1~~TRINITY_DN47398_c0_g1_i1.p1  ORF type:complete len:188 (+),score=51.52 TRINITY_DN47398_c0_g1_i1:68-565(+)
MKSPAEQPRKGSGARPPPPVVVENDADPVWVQARTIVRWVRENVDGCIADWWISRRRVARTGFLAGLLSATTAFTVSGPGAPVLCGWVLGGGYGTLARYRSQADSHELFRQELLATDERHLAAIVAELLRASPALREQEPLHWLRDTGNQRVIVEFLQSRLVNPA